MKLIKYFTYSIRLSLLLALAYAAISWYSGRIIMSHLQQFPQHKNKLNNFEIKTIAASQGWWRSIVIAQINWQPNAEAAIQSWQIKHSINHLPFDSLSAAKIESEVIANENASLDWEFAEPIILTSHIGFNTDLKIDINIPQLNFIHDNSEQQVSGSIQDLNWHMHLSTKTDDFHHNWRIKGLSLAADNDELKMHAVNGEAHAQLQWQNNKPMLKRGTLDMRIGNIKSPDISLEQTEICYALTPINPTTQRLAYQIQFNGIQLHNTRFGPFNLQETVTPIATDTFNQYLQHGLSTLVYETSDQAHQHRLTNALLQNKPTLETTLTFQPDPKSHLRAYGKFIGTEQPADDSLEDLPPHHELLNDTLSVLSPIAIYHEGMSLQSGKLSFLLPKKLARDSLEAAIFMQATQDEDPNDETAIMQVRGMVDSFIHELLKSQILFDLRSHYESHILYKDKHLVINGQSSQDKLYAIDYNPHVREPSLEDELIIKIWENDNAATKKLIADGANPRMEGKRFSTKPIIAAARIGNENIISTLLTAKTNANVHDSHGNNSLYWAARGGHLAAVKLLLKRGAKVNKANKNGWTPLQEAAENGHLQVVKVLLANGAKINHVDTQGRTALYWAANNGKEDVATYLMEQGADPYIRSSAGRNAIERALDSGHTNVARAIEKMVKVTL